MCARSLSADAGNLDRSDDLPFVAGESGTGPLVVLAAAGSQASVAGLDCTGSWLVGSATPLKRDPPPAVPAITERRPEQDHRGQTYRVPFQQTVSLDPSLLTSMECTPAVVVRMLSSRFLSSLVSGNHRPGSQPLIIKVLQSGTGDLFGTGNTTRRTIREFAARFLAGGTLLAADSCSAALAQKASRSWQPLALAIVGCGATGSALAGLLARAGVGTIRIIDRDYVEPSNLQRQSLFDEKDAAESLPKAIAAARKISAFNSQIVVEPRVEDLVPANIQALLEGMSLILDGTDNFETRYLINDYAVERSLPWIYSAAVGSYAVTQNILPGETACLACIFPDSPRGMVETCETSGILNSAVNLVASIAATEALKMLVGAGRSGDALCFPSMSGPTNTRRSPPPSLVPVAAPAENATSFISRVKAARTSRYAAGIRCKFMSANAPSTSLNSIAVSSPTAPCATTTSS